MHLRHTAYITILLFLLLQVAVTTARAAESVTEVPQIKAAMVFNMAKYVDWPPDTFARDDSPLVICTAGGGSMTAAMEILQGKQVKGHPVVVHQLSGAGESRSCHILVMGSVEPNALQNFLHKTSRQAVLTVSDRESFARSGGVVGFYREGNKLRFEINNEAAQEHRLKIGSQLLKLARIVRGNQP